mmetsp:Transcript_11814/g.22618  ORF Transcript_11814/g.22618 Transcript_11814/m.22618 type:complete len:482 (-) Transcript_11814:947-2392(-)
MDPPSSLFHDYESQASRQTHENHRGSLEVPSGAISHAEYRRGSVESQFSDMSLEYKYVDSKQSLEAMQDRRGSAAPSEEVFFTNKLLPSSPTGRTRGGWQGVSQPPPNPFAMSENSAFKMTTLGGMIGLRSSMLLRRDNDAFADSSSDDEAPFGYELTKHRHKFWNRVFRIGDPHGADKLMSFKKSLIRKSLLKGNRKNDKMMIQMHKNIMSFMRDRDSSKPPWKHAQKIIRHALRSPNVFRDEVYLLICKQTRGHPRIENAVTGWNLMILLLFCFPPSSAIKLDAYLMRSLVSTDSEEVLKRIKMTQKLLQLSIHYGERQEVPTEEEILSTCNLDLVDLIIQVPGHKKDLPPVVIRVDAFTTVAEAEYMISKKLQLGFPEAFGLFEANDHEESLLFSDLRVLDVVASWEKKPEEEEKNPKDHQQALLQCQSKIIHLKPVVPMEPEQRQTKATNQIEERELPLDATRVQVSAVSGEIRLAH